MTNKLLFYSSIIIRNLNKSMLIIQKKLLYYMSHENRGRKSKTEFLTLLLESYSQLYESNYHTDKNTVYKKLLKELKNHGIIEKSEYASMQKGGYSCPKLEISDQHEISLPLVKKEINDDHLQVLTTRCDSFFTCVPYNNFNEIISHLGSGNFGNVYQVYNELDQKKYAIKIVEIASEEDLTEVRIIAKLDHPNIIRYYSSWIILKNNGKQQNSILKREFNSSSAKRLALQIRNSGRSIVPKKVHLCIQTQIYDKTLEDYINSEKSREHSWFYFRQLCAGLKYLHDHGIIHRDLKPDNIFIDKYDFIKIGDFGLATFGVSSDDVGSVFYISPEQKKGIEYDQTSDLFSLGLIFYEMLREPYKTKMEKYRDFAELREERLPKDSSVYLTPKESTLILKLLSHDPNERLVDFCE